MVERSLREGQKQIDLEKLPHLGECVWLGGGGQEILSLVEQVRQGAVIDLNALHGLE